MDNCNDQSCLKIFSTVIKHNLIFHIFTCHLHLQVYYKLTKCSGRFFFSGFNFTITFKSCVHNCDDQSYLHNNCTFLQFKYMIFHISVNNNYLIIDGCHIGCFSVNTNRQDGSIRFWNLTKKIEIKVTMFL